ncbi:MBOAT family O-acyltransferase [Paenibacillus chitinolyticus]|uniref:MBOAT family O-acyltransferase n=1 Tax=Paenibacillus chitinolyticus TaxID=79263 RepID=UPI003864D0EB
MFYLNMNALLAMCGMVFVLMATRKWPQNKRILMLLFNLGFLFLWSGKLFAFYIAYTLLNYIFFVYLCRTPVWQKFAFALFILANIGAVILFHMLGKQGSVSLLADGVMTLGIMFNVLKIIDALYFAYFFGKDGQAKVIDYVNYILFVPTFTSGPILKFRDFMADVKVPYKVDAPQFEAGVKRIILGLFKKVVVVVWMTDLFNKVMDQELHTHQSLFLMIWFYLMIYMDFSGYSDIAVGFGRLMGFTIPENFKKPFLSPTLTQFWRNWHATLGDWFRDHIFIFFSRKTPSKLMTAGLSIFIMTLMGLWHGFSWLFLIYGVYHGVIIAIENLLGKTTVIRRKVSKPYFYMRCLLTQALVVAAIIINLNNPDVVMRIYKGLFHLPF